MDLVEAYRTFNLAPGAPEAQVRAVHHDMTSAWHPERFRADPAMYQQAVAATQRLNAALAAIAAAGFRMPQPYGQPMQPQQQMQQAYAPPMYPPPGMPQGGYRPPQPVSPAQMATEKKKQAGKNIALGLVLFIVGLAITVGTKDAAESSGGGTYVVAYGPMIGGAVLFFKGLVQLGSKS